ncbi:SGNH/GDSL hydrolase family protein [Luteolibacter sp. GHJ8]|uniref:SGNH/GDSL hydrolase family protein n=1 Tax=Luteolibacter rhizosphaerae TaxID=2989719 RepID=A0ABT3G9F4_9BACT|nr:SGNH/GDSL hydrolase family protein [Luteolibacter rhizosphaerae]MCW1916483.1 SGNH/GDSL hydrolase family protein [Luteolibacter rhizosphaerae]
MRSFLPPTGCSPGCSAGLAKTADKPLLARLALVGDSITELGASSMYVLNAVGAWGWARCFNGSGWDPVSSGSKLTFATSGKRSDELNALWLSAVVAAKPDACALLYGANDAAQLRTASAFLASCGESIDTLRAAGIRPLMFEVLPMSGSGQESRQAKVAELNLALRTYCRQRGVPLCRWAHVLETTPDTGIGSASYTPDNIHPNALASSRLGRYMAGFLRKHFRFADVWKNTNWISPNWRLEGNATDPFGWNAYPPSGGSIGAKSIIPDPAGNWWQVEMVKGTSSSYFSFATFGANTVGSIVGRTVESLCEVQVVAGQVGINCLQGYASPSSQLQYAVNSAADPSCKIDASDGLFVLRPGPRQMAAGLTSVYALLLAAPVGATATVRIRRAGTREIF